jgi:hypothetical protein
VLCKLPCKEPGLVILGRPGQSLQDYGCSGTSPSACHMASARPIRTCKSFAKKGRSHLSFNCTHPLQ